MNALLVRVGCDQTPGGGKWNGPVHSPSGNFVYVPIPETKVCREGLATSYEGVSEALKGHRVSLPSHLDGKDMHLDPDFEHLTYGDRGPKGKQLANLLKADDLLVFYSGLMDLQSRRLVYVIIGVLTVDRIDRAADWPESEWHRNAHTRRLPGPEADDVIVVGRSESSGRLSRCLPIGEYRSKAYRVTAELLERWGGISANDGYLQRSAVFPRLLDPVRFGEWFRAQGVGLVRANNIRPAYEESS